MKGSMCVARVLCLLLLAGSPALAFQGAGFGGGTGGSVYQPGNGVSLPRIIREDHYADSE